VSRAARRIGAVAALSRAVAAAGTARRRRTAAAACSDGVGAGPWRASNKPVSTMPCSKSVTLVCKRFRLLLYEQPGPWRRFEVPWASPKPDCYPAAKLALLRHVAPHVHEFVLCEEYTKRAWNRSPASFFRLLPSGLTGLKVRFHSAVPPAMAVLLRRLSALRSLCLWGHPLPAGLTDALQCQRHLEQLDIRMDECFDPDRLMAAVAQLSSLTQLSVVILASSRLRPPAPTAFPRMAAFYFLSDESPLEVRFCPVRCLATRVLRQAQPAHLLLAAGCLELLGLLAGGIAVAAR